jgi:hypothetical protein
MPNKAFNRSVSLTPSSGNSIRIPPTKTSKAIFKLCRKSSRYVSFVDLTGIVLKPATILFHLLRSPLQFSLFHFLSENVSNVYLLPMN